MSQPVFTRISRPIDPRHPTNLAILVLTLIVAGAAAGITFINGASLLPALAIGARLSVTFFLGWAIAREYDPDHPYSAFAAALATLVAYLLGYTTSLLFLAFLLLMLRYINRSTGEAATFVDLSAGLILTAWLSWTMDWTVGILAAAAYSIDGMLAEERRVRFSFAALGVLIAVVTRFWHPAANSFSGLNGQILGLAVGFLLISLPLYSGSRTIRTVGDLTGETLDPSRVRWAQVYYLFAVIMIGLRSGGGEPGDMIAAGSIIVGSSIYYLISRLSPRLRLDGESVKASDKDETR